MRARLALVRSEQASVPASDGAIRQTALRPLQRIARLRQMCNLHLGTISRNRPLSSKAAMCLMEIVTSFPFNDNDLGWQTGDGAASLISWANGRFAIRIAPPLTIASDREQLRSCGQLKTSCPSSNFFVLAPTDLHSRAARLLTVLPSSRHRPMRTARPWPSAPQSGQSSRVQRRPTQPMSSIRTLPAGITRRRGAVGSGVVRSATENEDVLAGEAERSVGKGPETGANFLCGLPKNVRLRSWRTRRAPLQQSSLPGIPIHPMPR